LLQNKGKPTKLTEANSMSSTLTCLQTFVFLLVTDHIQENVSVYHFHQCKVCCNANINFLAKLTSRLHLKIFQMQIFDVYVLFHICG